MGIDPAMMSLGFQSCGEVDSGRTVVWEDFLSYNFETGEAICLDAEIVTANERVRSSGETSTSFTSPAVLTSVPVLFGPPLRRCGKNMIINAVWWTVRKRPRRWRLLAAEMLCSRKICWGSSGRYW